jgi:hypothetical protein
LNSLILGGVVKEYLCTKTQRHAHSYKEVLAVKFFFIFISVFKFPESVKTHLQGSCNHEAGVLSLLFSPVPCTFLYLGLRHTLTWSCFYKVRLIIFIKVSGIILKYMIKEYGIYLTVLHPHGIYLGKL